ncbi:MAG: NAD(P)/FAD-dependent oxidoreductase [Salinirussus sp.]
MTRVAVVGAGVAGAGAATVLDTADLSVDVFERRDRVGGRAATRRRGQVVYDHGANYLKADDERVTALVTEELDTTGLVDIADPVYTFDESGDIAPGRDADEHKWTYESGLIELSRRLFGATTADVQLECSVREINNSANGWRVELQTGPRCGPYEGVVLTPPAPAAADLLTAGESPSLTRLADELAHVPFRDLYSAVLCYKFPLDRPYYALVDTSGEHAVSWVSREECKPGHVPTGASVLIVQASHDWTIAHDDETAEWIEDQLARHCAALLDEQRLTTPTWTDGCRWAPALPDGGVSAEVRDTAREEGLYLAGDGVVGAGRIHAALRSGLDAAERLLSDH